MVKPNKGTKKDRRLKENKKKKKTKKPFVNTKSTDGRFPI